MKATAEFVFRASTPDDRFHQREATMPFDFNTEYDPEFDAALEAAPEPKTTNPVKPQEAETRGKDAPAHNPMSLRFAKQFEFTDEEIQGMTPKELDAAVMAAHRVWLKTSRDLSRNDLQQRGGDKPAAPVAPAPVSSLTTRLEPKPEEDEYAEFTDLHPQVIAAIKKGREKDKAVIEGLQKKVEEAEGERVGRQREELFNAVDAEFAKMPVEVKTLIGEGGRHELTTGSLQHSVRKHILEAAERDTDATLTFAQKMHKAAKALVPNAPKPLVPAGVDAVAPEPAAQIAPAKPAPVKDTATGRFTAKSQEEREKAWAEGGTAVPTHRESPLPKGEKKAMETARKIMISKGLLSDEDMPDGSFLPSNS